MSLSVLDADSKYLYFEDESILIQGPIDRPLIVFDEDWGYCVVGLHVSQLLSKGVACLFNEKKMKNIARWKNPKSFLHQEPSFSSA